MGLSEPHSAPMMAASYNFSTGHIALTGVVSGALAALFAVFWLRGEHRTRDTLAIGALTAGAVFLLRESANMTELNDDGLEGFSANDWLAPTVTYVVLGLYGAVRPATERAASSRQEPQPRSSPSPSTS
jgi:putative exporter of polyketide antibiotics